MSEVSVRYIIDDVPAAVRFYTTVLGFTLEYDASPAFAAVSRDGVRLLLSGEGSSGKRPLADSRRQVPGGWNRIHLQVTNGRGYRMGQTLSESYERRIRDRDSSGLRG